MAATDVQEIVSSLERAFATVRRGARTLHEAEVIDDYGTEAERRQARARDPEDDWRDIPDASMQRCADALPHLDPVSWRFYLPAFMRLALRTMQRPRSPIDRVIYTLALGDDQDLNEYQRTRFSTLNREQVRVVHRFLELAADNDASCDSRVAKRALDKYWSRAIGD